MIKNVEMRAIVPGAIARSMRKLPVSSWKAAAAMEEKKKALNPYAASGKAVAVPRCLGKLVAAA